MMIPWNYAWLPLTIVLGYTWLRFESQWWLKKVWLGFERWFPGDIVKERWLPTGAAGISLVSVMAPDYSRKRAPFLFSLRAASTSEALHLAFGTYRMFPRLRADISVPWDEIQVRP